MKTKTAGNRKAYCLIISKKVPSQTFQSLLTDQFNLEMTNNFHFNPIPLLNSKRVECIIIVLSRGYFEILQRPILACKSRCSTIPIIGVVDEFDPEEIRNFGRIGMDRILHLSKMNTIAQVISELIDQKKARVFLIDLKLSESQYPPHVNKALQFLEKYYQMVFNISEISENLGLSECTISREFKKAGLASPKQILMEFKVRHALKLMTHSDLTLGQIGRLAGFTNEKRFNECFHRFFGSGPKKYGLLHVQNGVCENACPD